MKNFKEELNNVLEMLTSIEDEINLAGYTLTEKKVFFTITQLNVKNSVCNISDVINSSNLSRSTVYKAIKKLEKNNMLQLIQSNYDKREFFLDLSL
jgi:DNA-binding MarR family transcriptional regulator